MDEIQIAMTTRQEKAFDFAADLAKQLIALSTGIVTVITAFHKDIFSHEKPSALIIMLCGCVLLMLCTASGVATLMALTGALTDRDIVDMNLTPRVRDVAKFARAQVVFFIAGLSCAILYAALAAAQT